MGVVARVGAVEREEEPVLCVGGERGRDGRGGVNFLKFYGEA